MSGYNGRKGPNVSQYIANLNQIPPPNEKVESPPNDLDLSIFQDNDFIDWNAGGVGPLNQPLDLNFNEATNSTAAPRAPTEPNMDFDINSNFDFADFGNFNNTLVDQSIQPQQANFNLPPHFNAGVSPVSPLTPSFDQMAGKKRKADDTAPQNQHAIDEAARVAAEEDKRRRNTAASARFRVKKKQREQQLEKDAKDMQQRVITLESRVQQLETENAWLKGLITEKNGGMKSSGEVTALLKKRMEETNGERSSGNRTDGVGTKNEE